MSDALTIRKDGELDFLSLGALVHRLDPGIIPFRKARECEIHVSGGEFNVAANLSDCFGLQTAIVTRDGRLPHRRPDRRARARHGRQAVLQALQARRRHRPQHGHRLQRSRLRRARPVVFYNRCNEAAAQLKPGDFDWKAIFAAACAGSTAAASSRRSRPPLPS